jgi:hypothetical protein
LSYDPTSLGEAGGWRNIRSIAADAGPFRALLADHPEHGAGAPTPLSRRRKVPHPNHPQPPTLGGWPRPEYARVWRPSTVIVNPDRAIERTFAQSSGTPRPNSARDPATVATYRARTLLPDVATTARSAAGLSPALLLPSEGLRRSASSQALPCGTWRLTAVQAAVVLDRRSPAAAHFRPGSVWRASEC